MLLQEDECILVQCTMIVSMAIVFHCILKSCMVEEPHLVPELSTNCQISVNEMSPIINHKKHQEFLKQEKVLHQIMLPLYVFLWGLLKAES